MSDRPTRQALEERVLELERTVARLALEQEIVQTLHRYCHVIDHGPIDALDHVFTPDAAFDILTHDGRPNRDFVRKAGIRELKRYFQWRLDELFIEERYKHLVLSPLVVSADGDEARVASYFAAFSRDGDRPILRVYGRYQDTLVRRGGRWLIRERLSWQETPAASPRAPGEAGIDPLPPGAR